MHGGGSKAARRSSRSSGVAYARRKDRIFALTVEPTRRIVTARPAAARASLSDSRGNQGREKMRKLIRSCLVVLSCCVGNTVLAAPQTGWWWNPAESGRGFFVESRDGITFIGAYLYESDGHATWLVAGAPNADPYNF